MLFPPLRAMARRGLMAALLRPTPQEQRPPFHLLRRSFSAKLFVGGLSFRTDEEAVRRAFAQHGEVMEVKLISDRETGRPKGFGFVTFESEADAETARSKMTGQLLDGRVIRVDKAAASRPPLPSSGGSFNGMESSPFSSSLPPVAEDWGTIPSNAVPFPQNSASAAPTSSAAVLSSSPTIGSGMGEQVGSGSAKPFDSSSFGQATAWPSSTSSPSSSLGGIGGQTSSDFGKSFDSNSFGSAAAWPSNPAAPSSSASGEQTGSDFSKPFNSSTFGSAATAPSSSPIGGGLVGQTSTDSSKPFATTTLGAAAPGSKPFDSTPFGSASLNSSSTTVSFNSSSTSSATTIQSTTTIANTTSSTISGLPDISKPLEPGTTGGSTPVSPDTTTPLRSPALTSSGGFDFSNFSFDNSSYRDNDPPLPRRRPRPRPRLIPQSTMASNLNFNSNSTSVLETRSPFGSNNQFAETGIPKPKGPEFDFGSLNITAISQPGARPQGGFDTNIPDDLEEVPPVEEKPKPKPLSLSMFPWRTLPSVDLPWDTPEADNWSEIGEDPPKYDLSSLYPSMGALLKKDKELHWDPYDFDEEAKLPPEEEVVEDDSDYD